MTSRPVVSVYSKTGASQIVDSVPLPAVFTAPIRDDIVQFVHANMNKNRRQAHGVFHKAGMQHAAESWGTGRAVARIPRIGGSGTSRSGQGAFGNQCRKGRMFAPLKTYRRWHRKINVNQKRHAVAAAVAATAVTPLVLARGHRVMGAPELPLVVDSLNVDTTKALLTSLKNLGAGEDLKRARDSKKVRVGQGKLRNSRYVLRRGPLIVYGDENEKVKQVARNLPGVDFVNVHRLNLLQLAPGGHLGRFVIWTREAFKALNGIFGNWRRTDIEKGGYVLNRSVMSCADLARIINSDQVQAKLRAPKTTVAAHTAKKNPLTNKALMNRLNPFNKIRQSQPVAKKAAVTKVAAKKARALRSKKFNEIVAGMQDSFVQAEAAFQRIGAEAESSAEEDEDEQ